MKFPFVFRSRFEKAIRGRQKLEAKATALADTVTTLREDLARCRAYLESSNAELLDAKTDRNEIKFELAKEREYIRLMEDRMDKEESVLRGTASPIVPIGGRPTLRSISHAADVAARKRAEEGGPSIAAELADALYKGRKDAKVG